MDKAISRDGTVIAYDKVGSGPALILVDGAMCYRASGPSGPLAALLAPHFTVYTYDRRGRGDSTDTLPFAVDREVEDIEALIAAAGGSAYVYGISSGAALALEAARAGLPITKLALYEAPFIVDDSRAPVPDDYLTRLKELVAADKRSAAVKSFMKIVGVPAFLIPVMPLMPGWSKGLAVAHTLPYDITLMNEYMKGKPLPDRWSGVAVPTLVGVGGKSPAWMRNGMRALADALPAAEERTLPGQTHMLKAEAIAPVLVGFFRS